jgi:hypothetical protein
MNLSPFAESLAQQTKAISEQPDEKEKKLWEQRIECEVIFEEISKDERDQLLSLLWHTNP